MVLHVLFDGNQVKLGNLSFEILEKFISKATKLPMTRERWFKNQLIILVNLNHFLKPEKKDP